jgi:ABC-type Zn uptake system ZnuABC Zn-binding protein ZnuA
MNRSLHILIVLLALAACNAAPAPSGPRVVAAETWLADIAQNVSGDRLQVASLLRPGVDPHEFQPAPQDTILLALSRLLIVNGLGYEPWLEASLQDAGGQRILLTASDGVSTAARGGEVTATDPHAWMDPTRAITYVGNIRNALTQLDPAGKDAYASNAAAYVARLRALDASIRTQVDAIPLDRRMLVTNHDSLGYFAEHYGFHVIGAVIPSVTSEASPSAQQMAALIDTLKQTHAPAIFLDASENPKLAQQIASATGAKVVTELYVETLSARDGPAPTYIAMLQHDADVIVAALK